MCIQQHLCILQTHMQDLGDTMTKFFVNVATAEEIGVEVEHAGMVDTGEVNPELPRGRRKIQGACINLSFGSLGYTHFLAQFSGRVSSVVCSLVVAMVYYRQPPPPTRSGPAQAPLECPMHQ